jgi:ribosome-associated heat shock protein Hsp15
VRLGQRIDKWLVYSRIVKHRSLACALIETGRLRINRERANKPSQTIKSNDIITVTIDNQVRVLKVLGEAARRGPASEARLLYADLTQKEDASPPSIC